MKSVRRIALVLLGKRINVFLLTIFLVIFAGLAWQSVRSSENKAPNLNTSHRADQSCCPKEKQTETKECAAKAEPANVLATCCSGQVASDERQGVGCGLSLGAAKEAGIGCGGKAASLPVQDVAFGISQKPAQPESGCGCGQKKSAAMKQGAGCGSSASQQVGKTAGSCGVAKPLDGGGGKTDNSAVSCCGGKAPSVQDALSVAFIAKADPSSVIILTDEQMKQLKGGHCTCGPCNFESCFDCYVRDCGSYCDSPCPGGGPCYWCEQADSGDKCYGTIDDCDCQGGSTCTDCPVHCYLEGRVQPCGGVELCDCVPDCSTCGYICLWGSCGIPKSCPTSCTNCSGDGNCLICYYASPISCNDGACQCLPGSGSIAFCNICADECLTAPVDCGSQIKDCNNTNCGQACPGGGDCKLCSEDPNIPCTGIQHCGCGCGNDTICPPRCSFPGGTYEPCGGKKNCRYFVGAQPPQQPPPYGGCRIGGCDCALYCPNGNKPCGGSRNCHVESSPNCDPCSACCCFCRLGGKDDLCFREPLENMCVRCWSGVGCLCTCP